MNIIKKINHHGYKINIELCSYPLSSKENYGYIVVDESNDVIKRNVGYPTIDAAVSSAKEFAGNLSLTLA